jgi:hypothetical protein
VTATLAAATVIFSGWFVLRGGHANQSDLLGTVDFKSRSNELVFERDQSSCQKKQAAQWAASLVLTEG